jgi:hypothetical protein
MVAPVAGVIAAVVDDPRWWFSTSAGHDRRRERDPMVLRPRRSHRRPSSVQDLVGSPTEHSDRLTDHVLRFVEVDVPATIVCELGEHLAVHDGVGAGLVRRAALEGDVVGESPAARPGARSR